MSPLALRDAALSVNDSRLRAIAGRGRPGEASFPLRSRCAVDTLGTLIGVILHLKHRSRASANKNDFNQSQRLPSVPKTSFIIVRVICVIVGLLFLLSLLFWVWVLSTPHR